jgi:hypothetical protein
MGRVAGMDHTRFDTSRKIHLKSELKPNQIKILQSLGFREVRDPGFSQGRGTAYMVYNSTGESSRHFILWNLIFDEAKKYTKNVEYNLTRLPDVVFEVDVCRWAAVEVEASRKTEKQLQPKLEHLRNRYKDWFFVVADYDLLEHYRRFGPTFTRTQVRDVIAGYFGVDLNAEPKTEPE